MYRRTWIERGRLPDTNKLSYMWSLGLGAGSRMRYAAHAITAVHGLYAFASASASGGRGRSSPSSCTEYAERENVPCSPQMCGLLPMAKKLSKKSLFIFFRLAAGWHLRYQDFAPMFTCANFDPTAWAELFSASGAQGLTMTSKHHEGWTLWGNARHANWNAVDTGIYKYIYIY